jgi:UDP-glucose 4-epimerase
MIKVLITGNSGYIGSHLTQLLKTRNDVVLYGLDKNFPVVEIDNFIHQNINSLQQLADIEFDCVIHLAAEVSVSESVKDPTLYYTTNTFGTLNVLEKIKTKNFVCASTGAADGMISPYGISKKAMEEIVKQYCSKNNINYTIFRFYNVVGTDGIAPTNPDGLFYSLLNARSAGTFTLFGDNYSTRDGSCVRDYVHVNEICNALISAISTSSSSIENLGHGRGTTVKEMIDIFKKVNQCEFNVIIGPRREGDIESSVLSNPSVYMKKIYSIDQLLKL